jgi:hypothetical protein
VLALVPFLEALFEEAEWSTFLGYVTIVRFFLQSLPPLIGK